MADNYYITINSEKICVSEEVYNVYRQMRRHERTLAEKDSRNFVLKYEDFADGEITGEEQIYTNTNISGKKTAPRQQYHVQAFCTNNPSSALKKLCIYSIISYTVNTE